MPSGNNLNSDLLDVEDNDARLHRLQILLEHANASSAPHPPRTAPATLASSFDFGKRETHAVQPPTELLSRLEAFLPQIAAANAELAHRIQLDPASVDIENIDDAPDGQYIAMNLGLGVFDVRHAPSNQTNVEQTDSEEDSDESQHTSCSSPAGTSGDSDSENDIEGRPAPPSADMIGAIMMPSQSRPTRPLPQRAKPSIVVLNETANPADD